MSFADKRTTRLGAVGERIVDEHLAAKGFVPYAPSLSDCPHAFDRLIVKRNKREVFIAECKTKPQRVRYPDQGIDIRHYNEYRYIQDKYGLRTFLFFVDSDRAAVYGHWLDVLDEPREVEVRPRETRQYPWRSGGIIYFPTEIMRHIRNLDPDVVMELRGLSSRAEKYETAPF